MGQSASTPSTNLPSNSSQGRSSSLAATWVPLLLRLLAALEQGMRFEAQWGPSQPEVDAKGFDLLGELAGKLVQGPAWGATYLLLSQNPHPAFDWLESPAGADQAARSSSTSSHDHQPALLQWLLDNTPPEQLPAVQQQVLSLLCTTSKVCLSAQGGSQLTQAAEVQDCIFHTAWGVWTGCCPCKQRPPAAMLQPQQQESAAAARAWAVLSNRARE
jgi:hypothetical protein